MSEMPHLTASAYASHTVQWDKMFNAQGIPARSAKGAWTPPPPDVAGVAAMLGAPGERGLDGLDGKTGKETQMATRIIKVFIADTNQSLPLEKQLLYSGEEKLTDLTDQELYFELPMAKLLADHNEVRKATTDKKMSEKFGRDIFLEPARIRDLNMVVVTVAKFEP